MSTNKTTHLSLHQWAQTDPIHRTEFNENFQSIDDAVAELARSIEEVSARSRFTKLKEVNVTADTTALEIDLSDIDWSRWDKVHIDCLTTNGQQMPMSFVTASTSQAFYLSGMRSKAGVYHPRMTLYPAFQPSRFIFASYGGATLSIEDTYGNLSKISISGSTMYAGAKFVLWGEV